MGRRWLTPDVAPGTYASRCVFIPDSVDWIAIVVGALLPLTFPQNFEAYGTATPQQTADEYTKMFNDFCFNVGICRVIGEIVATATLVNPNPGYWVECDGASLDRAMFSDLFDAIGTTYGSVDSTHFNVPDLRGRTVIGVGTGSGLSARTLGDSIGEETHILTAAELASHGHSDTGHSHAESIAIAAVGAAIVGVPVPSAISGIGTTGISSAVITSTGGDSPHNNIQPSIALNYYIVAV